MNGSITNFFAHSGILVTFVLSYLTVKQVKCRKLDTVAKSLPLLFEYSVKYLFFKRLCQTVENLKYNSAVSNCIYSSVTDFSLATQSVSWRGAKWPQWRCSYKGKAICCRNNNCGVYCHIYQYEFLSVMCLRLENSNEIYIFVPVPGWEYLLDERLRWISARYHANESFLATWSFLLASE